MNINEMTKRFEEGKRIGSSGKKKQKRIQRFEGRCMYVHKMEMAPIGEGELERDMETHTQRKREKKSGKKYGQR